MSKLSITCAIAAVVAFGFFTTPSAKAERLLFNVGTGGITGSFWATGGQVRAEQFTLDI